MGKEADIPKSMVCVVNYKGMIVCIGSYGELKKYRARGIRNYKKSDVAWMVEHGLLDSGVIENIKDFPRGHTLIDDNTGKRISATLDKKTVDIMKQYRMVRNDKVLW